jgi:uncharacterized cysteine cluster protein YcgN (CxxCxxCC family)
MALRARSGLVAIFSLQGYCSRIAHASVGTVSQFRRGPLFLQLGTGAIHFTKLACKLLDTGSCRCRDYENRKKKVPDCVKIDARKVRELKWLPKTCAYRLLAEGKDLAWWHPLVSGSSETVHEAGISVRGIARGEGRIDPANYVRYIVEGVE